ncbi:hypothetical protein [Streptomyces sp. KL116D]|uniref:hypothetical protein n=1 Tax=Streptomyces sp. KL116D TaxID=3045152 RepID=UPI0035588499
MDPARRAGVGGDAELGPPAADPDGEQHVGGLRLGVGDERVVGAAIELRVVEVESGPELRAGLSTTTRGLSASASAARRPTARAK